MHRSDESKEFPGQSVALLLLAEALAVLIVPMLVIGRSIDTLVAAERRVFGQAWSLRQLMPDEAQGAAVAGLAGPDDVEDDCIFHGESGC